VLWRHLTFHKVVYRHIWGVVGSCSELVIVLLYIFSWFWQWNNFENRLIFDEVKAYQKNCAINLGPPCIFPLILYLVCARVFRPYKETKVYGTTILYADTDGLVSTCYTLQTVSVLSELLYNKLLLFNFSNTSTWVTYADGCKSNK